MKALGFRSGRLRPPGLEAALFCLGLAGLLSPLPASGDDLAADFSVAANPNGRWSYGWIPAAGGALRLYTHPYPDQGDGFEHWELGIPAIMHNVSGVEQHPSGTSTIPPDGVCTHPGAGQERAVVRWTAPWAGRCGVTAEFAGQSGYLGAPLTTTGVQIRHNGLTLFSASLNLGGAPNSVGWQGDLDVAAGDSLDFLVDDGGNGYAYDSTGPSVSISFSPTAVETPAAAPGPWLELGPNPTSGPLRLALRASRPTRATLRIYDARGRLVRELASGEIAAGTTGVAWDGRGDDGAPAPSGVYLVSLREPGTTVSRRFVIAR